MKNFVNLSIKILATFSIIIFFYSIYRAEINFIGHDRSFVYAKYLKYIIFSFFLFIFYILSLKFRKKLRNNVALFSYSIIFVIYLIELILLFNFNYIPQINPHITMDNDAKVSQRKQLSKIKNLIDKNIYPFSGREIFLEENQKIYPLGYLSNTDILFCRKDGKNFYYKSDKHGFRNSNNVWGKKTYDHVLIGDSFVQGSCVKDKDTMSNLIAKKTKKDVLNLGIGGFGPLAEYATFLEFVEKKKPQKVYWFFYEGNDLTKDIRYEKKIPILMDYFLKDKTQGLIYKQDLVDNYIKKKILNEINLKEKVIKTSKSVNQKTVILNIDNFLHKTKFLRLWGTRTLIKHTFVNEDVDPIFKKILEKTNTKIKEWDGEMIFIYLPEEMRYKNKFNFHFAKDNFRNKKNIINLVKSLNIKLIDIDSTIFRKQEDPLALFNNHYTEEGYNLIVNEILKIN